MSLWEARCFVGSPINDCQTDSNFLRTLALPEEVKQWSMTTLRDRQVKIGAKIARDRRLISFQMPEVLVPHTLFQ